MLNNLADRWHLDFGSLIQRGHTSVVMRCSTADGRSAALKLSPERGCVRQEAAALTSWSSDKVPAVLAEIAEALDAPDDRVELFLALVRSGT